MKKTQAIVPASTASPQTGETMVVDGCTIKISYAAKSDGQQMNRKGSGSRSPDFP
jgi:hypothetical protein